MPTITKGDQKMPVVNPPPIQRTREEELLDDLKGQELLLGRKQRALGEAIADNLDTEQPSQDVDAVLKRMTEIKIAIGVIHQREQEAAEAKKLEAEQIKQGIRKAVQARVYARIGRFQQRLVELREEAKELGSDLNALRSLGDRISEHQANVVSKNVKYHVLHHVRQFPGCELGLSAFLKFDERPFSSLFPKDQD